MSRDDDTNTTFLLDDVKTTPFAGWKVSVSVVDAERSQVLTTFLSLKPPRTLTIDSKDNIFFRSGDLFKIPGIPDQLDSISHLARTDSSPDAKFYANPRLVTHIDDDAIEALTNFYREHLKNG